MMLAQTLEAWEVFVIVLYAVATAYLGWLGWRRTRTAADYMVAGRETHPFIMAMSYGSTFISTSAIVGFGGVAGQYGMGILWLVFLNIFVGIFIAFIFLGSPTRRMGHQLDAHTFPELLGKRFQSKFIQVFAGSMIFLFMPLYSAAVLIGGAKFVEIYFGMPATAALLVLSVIVAAYVIWGGIKGVMYTDALQGVIMVAGMLVLLVYAYFAVGGITAGHQALSDMKSLVPDGLRAGGHTGWTSMPTFGFGGKQYDIWWFLVSAVILGVGIGVLAQPQLVVRFMTVKSRRELNRAVIYGGLFILLIPGSAYVVGALSNAYFIEHGVPGQPVVGRVLHEIEPGKMDPSRRYVMVEMMIKDDAGRWKPFADKAGKRLQVPIALDAHSPNVEGAAAPDGKPLDLVQGRSISIAYAKADFDKVIPTFISSVMPKWFGVVFLMTLLAAAMSTLSSQFHVQGTSISRDIYEALRGRAQPARGITVVRLGVVAGILLAVVVAIKQASMAGIIARATAVFFGLCSAAFLPAFVGGLFWKRMTRAGAIASMITGIVATLVWLTLFKAQEAAIIGIGPWLTGNPAKASLLSDCPNWPSVDAIVIALPLSILAAVVVSLLTRPPAPDHIARCFPTTAAVKNEASEVVPASRA